MAVRQLPGLITASAAGRLLGLSPWRVRQAVAAGLLPVADRTDGGQMRFRAEDVRSARFRVLEWAARPTQRTPPSRSRAR